MFSYVCSQPLHKKSTKWCYSPSPLKANMYVYMHTYINVSYVCFQPLRKKSTKWCNLINKWKEIKNLTYFVCVPRSLFWKLCREKNICGREGHTKAHIRVWWECLVWSYFQRSYIWVAFARKYWDRFSRSRNLATLKFIIVRNSKVDYDEAV